MNIGGGEGGSRRDRRGGGRWFRSRSSERSKYLERGEVEEMELVIGETGEDNLAKGEKNLFIEHHMSTDVHPGRHLCPVRRITQRNTG